MTSTSEIQSAVVIGGAGKTGARVAHRLTAAGVWTRTDLPGRILEVTGPELLESPARDFTTFAAETARTGVWS
ncbi:hypothetical protein ACFRFQ_10390 [Rhodococcus sp. NPDC056743]|uniref:hypothetical protein n=1 Tax=Rhodococcus sp. NPDC056743 TaxID=3345934 RepID=UPI003672A64D